MKSTTPRPRTPKSSWSFKEVQFTDWDTRALGFNAPEHPSDAAKRIVREIGRLGERHLVLFQDNYPGFIGSENVEANFTSNPDFMIGREQSRQGVYAGPLSVTAELPTISTFVAVKPFDPRDGKRTGLRAPPAHAVVHDLATNLHLNRISSGTAYTPYGILTGDDEFIVPSLITEFNERATSLNNTFLDKPSDTEAHKKRVLRAIELGSFGLGVVHGARMIHGDAYPHNFAVDGKTIIVNDTTTVRPFYRSRATNKQLIKEDVRDFFDGVFDKENSSDMSRSIALSALRGEEVQNRMHDIYLDGVRLGAERADFSQGGLSVDDRTYTETINNAIEKSVTTE